MPVVVRVELMLPVPVRLPLWEGVLEGVGVEGGDAVGCNTASKSREMERGIRLTRAPIE